MSLAFAILLCWRKLLNIVHKVYRVLTLPRYANISSCGLAVRKLLCFRHVGVNLRKEIQGDELVDLLYLG